MWWPSTLLGILWFYKVEVQGVQVQCILSFSLAPLKQCADFYFLIFACCLYIKSTSGGKKNCSEIYPGYILEVSVKHFQSFKPKFLVPVPKAGEFFLDVV